MPWGKLPSGVVWMGELVFKGGGASTRWPLASLRGPVSLLWLLVALGGFAVHTNDVYPLREWLIFFWARAWLGALAFALASLSAGVRVLALFGVKTTRLLERYTLAMAAGVLTFALGIYAAGYAGLLGRVFFFAWPALLLLAGGRPLARELGHVASLSKRLGVRLVLPQRPVQALAALLALAGVLVLYLHVVTPASILFDARWYHLPIAENYAVAGQIRPFPEGWYLAAYPHLASVLYTWAFLAPGELEHHLILVVHLEFVLVLATVVGISALAERLLAGARLVHGGAALFLFPCIFLPDSALNGGADDVLAFWAPPLGLALLRYLKSATAPNAVLLGAILGAAGLTKYQAIYLLVAIALVLAVDLVRRRKPLPLLGAAGTALLVSSPHWLKNWIAYGDPLYPNLYRWLPAHPFFHGAAEWLPRGYWLNGANRSLSWARKLRGLGRALVGFSFSPHGWAATPVGRPLFGSLFTLLLPLLFWARPRWRVLLIAGSVHVGLVVWYFTYVYDRFLMSMLPWMAACTAAALATLWRTGLPSVRIGTGLLVAFQLAWGADIHFLSGSPLRSLLDHVAAGDAKNFARTAYPGVELQAIGKKIRDPTAKVVGHDFYQSVGAGVQSICDNPAWQGSIDYLALDTPERTLKRWTRLGATHVLWPAHKEARAPEDLARDAVFARAATAFTRGSFNVAGYEVEKLVHPSLRAHDREPTRIAWLACGTERKLGIYTPKGLAFDSVEAALSTADLARDPSAALAKVNAVWSRASCDAARSAGAVLSDEFKEVLRSDDAVLAVRKRR